MRKSAALWRASVQSGLIALVVLASATDAKGENVSYTGAGSCAARNCHGSPTPRDYSRLSRQDEYLIWSGDRRLKESYGEDRHRTAYTTLLTGRGLKIARTLGLVGPRASAETWIEDAATPERCLTCHAVYDLAAAPGSTIVPSD